MQNAGSLIPAPGAHPLILGTGTVLFSGTLIRGLTISTSGFRALQLAHGTAEQLEIYHQATTALPGERDAVEIAWGGLLRDSVVVERGDDATAVDAGAMDAVEPSKVENVTAIATGARGVGVRALQVSCAPYAGHAVSG